MNWSWLRISAPEGEPRFRFVDALRTIAIVWIALFHVIFYRSFFISHADADRLFGAWQSRWILRGHFALDMLFVITGFLIGYYVLADADRGKYSFGPWLFRRMARLVPAYFVVLLLFGVTAKFNFAYAWANVIFVNNYLPVMHQAMGWSWSLPVDVAFYFTFPLVLLVVRDRSKYLFDALVYIFLALLVVRGYVELTGHLALPLQVNPNGDVAGFEHYFDTMYDKTHTRIGAVVCGLMVIALVRYRGAEVWLSARPLIASALGIGAAIVAIGVLAAPVLPGEAANYDPLWSALYLICYNYAFSLAFACLLLLALTSNVLVRPVRWVLSWRGWFVLSELCYGSFLLNPLVILGLYAFVFHWPGIAAWTFVVYAVTAVAATFGLAYVLYVTVERPTRSGAKRFVDRFAPPMQPAARPESSPEGAPAKDARAEPAKGST